MAEAPRPAATVLLLREEGSEVEALMVRRHADLAVMGGVWVFPGGAVEPADGEGMDAIRFAACRETFEEAGIRIDPAALVLWTHWITPSLARVRSRFDTFFFVAAMPRDQEPLIDELETVDHRWLSAAATAGEPSLVPPTRLNLLDVHDAFVRHGGLGPMLAAEAARRVPAITPRLLAGDGHPPTVVLPWDPAYASLPGEGTPLDDPPAHLARLPSRVAFDPPR